MTAQTSRQGLSFEQLNMLSYHSTWGDADYEPQLPALRRSVPARLFSFVGTHLQAARARRVAASEMGAMSDREFADIGITRCDTVRVLDPAFVPDHQRAHI